MLLAPATKWMTIDSEIGGVPHHCIHLLSQKFEFTRDTFSCDNDTTDKAHGYKL
jgi:hypothetical protein